MFLFEGQAVVINIRAETRNKRIYTRMLAISVIFCISFFSFFASYCYYSYRDVDVKDIFMLNLVPVKEVVVLIILMVSFNAMCSYPLQILAAFEIYEAAEFFKSGSASSNRAKVLLCRTVIVVIVSCIALIVPNFTDFINIAGSLGSTIIGFVIPPLIYLKEFPETKIGHRCFCYFVIVFGILAGGSSIVFSVIKLAYGENN